MVEIALKIGMILLLSQSPSLEVDEEETSRLKLTPAVTVPLLQSVYSFAKEPSHSPIVLCLGCSKLTDLISLAITSASRQIVVSRFASIVLLEDCIIVLKQHSDVVPKCGRQLRAFIGHRRIKKTSICILRRIKELPRRPILVRRRRDVGKID